MNIAPMLFVAIPLFFTVAGACSGSVILMAVGVLLLFALVALLPVCRKRENLWMFSFAAITMIPVNIYILIKLDLYDYSGASILRTVMWCILILGILTAVEEIVLGLITRLIWNRQYRLPDSFFC